MRNSLHFISFFSVFFTYLFIYSLKGEGSEGCDKFQYSAVPSLNLPVLVPVMV